MRKPIVAIIGRPNVGKSTLFNRIIRKREAIVDDQPGVTRDRIYAEAEWAGVNFSVIDTGGYLPDKTNTIHRAVLEQVLEAIHEADIILFVVDGRVGITNLDEEIGSILRKSNRTVFLVVNKIDDEKHEPGIHDFYNLGIGEPYSISAISGRSTGDLLDEMIHALPELPGEDTGEHDDVIKLAVVGKPNVGKSSLVNAIIGKQRHIVTETPGTTRDSIDTDFNYQDQRFVMIDTAGLRKRTKVKDEVEYYSAVRTIRSIRECDVTIVLIDANDSLQDQDKSIIEQAIKYNKGIVLGVNKWDLIEKDTHTARQFELDILDALPSISFVPIVFISALTKQRIYKVLDIAKSVYEERMKLIKTSDLNAFLEKTISFHPPPSVEGKYIKIKYCTQIKTRPPVFAFFCNYPNLIKPNYRSYLENRMREQFGFFGVPLTLTFRRK
ncbi:ribosome biogenesis GTPase Der [candidate division KSB1 bacterium]|nr:ribosome biogenesis GTPase Der [candidate division KSB1 bacterium]